MLNRILVVSVAASMCALEANACSHQWKLNELYSNADGSIQFIEMHIPNAASAENFIAGLKVRSVVTGKFFQFPANLQGSTAFKYLLLATQSFADLPGAPTPDYIIPPHFFAQNGDTIIYHVYDSWTFSAAQLPDECGFSLNRDLSIGRDTPTNYAGVQGYGDPCVCAADIDASGGVDAADLGALFGDWGTKQSDADLNGDGTVDAADLAIMLGAWGPCD